MQNQFIQHRQAAIDWLNSDRKFEAGISLLETSKFKPGTVQKLKRDGINGREAAARLVHLMRMLVQAWALPQAEAAADRDDTGSNPADNPELHTDEQALKLVEAARMLESGKEVNLTSNVIYLVKTYSEAYKSRDIAHREMASLPDDNEPATVEKRKSLSDEIARYSTLMERLYPYYERYTQDGTDLTDDEVKKLQEFMNSEPADDEDNDENNTDLSAMSKEQLQALRKSVATKISRARNQLDFQQETKADTPNPMPDSPKRVKYEAKIAKLTPELERIDYAIAALG